MTCEIVHLASEKPALADLLSTWCNTHRRREVECLRAEVERLRSSLMEIQGIGFSSRSKDYMKCPQIARASLEGGPSSYAEKQRDAHMEVKEKLWKDLEGAKLQIEDWKAYVKLLGEECMDYASWMASRSPNWKSSRYEEGRRLRIKLGIEKDTV